MTGVPSTVLGRKKVYATGSKVSRLDSKGNYLRTKLEGGYPNSVLRKDTAPASSFEVIRSSVREYCEMILSFQNIFDRRNCTAIIFNAAPVEDVHITTFWN